MEIVVGVDGSSHGYAAARWAAREAELREARLVILHAYTVPALPSSAGPVRTEDQRTFARSEALEVAARARQAAADEVGPDALSVAVEVYEGPVEEILVGRSRDAQMLVLGAHTGVLRSRLGGVTRWCLRHAGCPVVVVAPDAVVPTKPALSGSKSAPV